MPYSDRQRSIAALIAERGNLSTVEYLLGLAREQREVEGTLWQEVVSADPRRFQMFIPQWNQRNSWLLFGIEHDTHMAVIDYLTVVRDLLARKLVTVLPDPKRHVRPAAIVSSLNPPSLSERDQSALEIDALLQTTSELLNLAIYTERVYALPSLKDFVAQGCQTKDELARHQSGSVQNDQLRSLNRLSIGLIFLIVLLMLGLLTAVLWHLRCPSSACTSTPSANSQSPAQNSLSAQAQSAPLILRDTVVIHDTIPAPTKHPKKKKRRRYIDMSE